MARRGRQEAWRRVARRRCASGEGGSGALSRLGVERARLVSANATHSLPCGCGACSACLQSPLSLYVSPSGPGKEGALWETAFPLLRPRQVPLRAATSARPAKPVRARLFAIRSDPQSLPFRYVKKNFYPAPTLFPHPCLTAERELVQYQISTPAREGGGQQAQGPFERRESARLKAFAFSVFPSHRKGGSG